MYMQAANTLVRSLLLSALFKDLCLAMPFIHGLSDHNAVHLPQSSDAPEMIVSNASFDCACTGPLSGIVQMDTWL